MAEATTLLRILEFVALLIPAIAIIMQLIYRMIVSRNETESLIGFITIGLTAIAFIVLLDVAYETIEALIAVLPTNPYESILSGLRSFFTYFVLAILALLYYSYRVGKTDKTTKESETQSQLNEFSDNE